MRHNEDMTEEQQKALEQLSKEQEDIERAVEAIQRLAQAIVEAFNPVIKIAIETFKTLWDKVLHCYPNKKVLHLALYHPKERVRKKNMRRIMRWIEGKGR